MKIFRKALLFVLASVLVLCSAACGSGTDAREETVKQAVYSLIKAANISTVDTVEFNDVKIYTQEEIDANELLKDYDLGKDDIVFEVIYDVKLYDGVDVTPMTAGEGQVDGQWVRNKFNCGVLKYNDGSYSIESFGTSF